MAAQKTNAKKKKRRRKQHRGLTVFFTVFIMLFMIGVVTGGLVALDIFTDVGILSFGPVDTSKDVAGVDYIDLDAYIANQSQTTIIYGYDEDGDEIELARLHGSENRIWCELDEMSQYLKDAAVALEDKRFYMHDGVDWVRTIGVVVEYHFSQGGSTITQQLIKNLTGENSRTFKRKYSEIKNALSLEKHFSKDTILEAYLNTIYLDMGCYGVKTAAEYYFDKTPAELTLMESAILASITNAPRKYDPIVNYNNNRQRAVECLDNMLEQGYITEAEYNEAIAEDVHFVGVHHEDEEDYDEYDEEVAISSTSEVQSYYVDYIIEQV
ncbi:MAG: transglycosylase domain-containing protein, partial [Clostridia bacterium]|nr:transglycosylase domain-containing protein [Clostridia bacterium]